MPSETDRLLSALAEQVADDGLPAPADETLRAYRDGGLADEEARELEKVLARSAAGRRRLVELAGIDRSLPLRRVRKAVLGQRTRRRRLATWTSVAAAAAMIVLAVLTLLPRRQGLPAGLTYDVAARGLAERRSLDEPAGALRAYPATTVRIQVRPRGDSPAGVVFALYRRQGGVLRRVQPPDEVRMTSERGSATFAGPAAGLLATRTPGIYPLLLVVTARDTLPSLIALEPGQVPAAALRAPGRLIYPLTVTLLAEEPPAEERDDEKPPLP